MLLDLYKKNHQKIRLILVFESVEVLSEELRLIDMDETVDRKGFLSRQYKNSCTIPRETEDVFANSFLYKTRIFKRVEKIAFEMWNTSSKVILHFKRLHIKGKERSDRKKKCKRKKILNGTSREGDL